MEPKLVLITLLIKLGVAAAVSSALARSRTFQNLLFREHRSFGDNLKLVAFVCTPLALGVWVRVSVRNFLAADISMEATVLCSILCGPLAGVIAGCLLAVPAVLHHEFLTLPFNVLVAAVSGIYALFADPEDVWSFSPFIDLSIYRWIRRNLRRPRFDWQIFLAVIILAMQVARCELAEADPGRLFALESDNWLVRLAVYVTPVVVVGIPLKIWNAIRIERKLEEQERLLLQARLEALQRQINPHFLFNTLNSVASLVRFQPDTARDLIVKLANILRAMLKNYEAFVPFREELHFVEDYLGIEVVRFGSDKLRVVKDIAPETLDAVLPSMLLQPLVENSIKHGLEPRIEGGTITLRSRLEGRRLVVQVEDDGVGIAPPRAHGLDAPPHAGSGIGMSNVAERLKVLYGADARMNVNSRPGRGTLVTLEMPVLQADPDRPGTAPAVLYAARSTSRS